MNGAHTYPDLGMNKGTCLSREISKCPTHLSYISPQHSILPQEPGPKCHTSTTQPGKHAFLQSTICEFKTPPPSSGPTSFAHSFSLLSDDLQPHIPALLYHCSERPRAPHTHLAKDSRGLFLLSVAGAPT